MASPVDAARAGSSTTAAGTSHTISLPTGIVAGSLVVIATRFAVASVSTWPAEWQNFLRHDVSPDAADDVNTVVYRKCDGTEGASITVTTSVATKMATIARRVSGHEDPVVQAPQINADATGNSVNPDCGSISPIGGSKDYLFFALDQHSGEQTSTVTYPTNYINTQQVTSGTGGAVATNCQINSGTRQLTAVSEDPTAFTISGAQEWTAWTLAVHPPGAAATSLLFRPSTKPLIVR